MCVPLQQARSSRDALYSTCMIRIHPQSHQQTTTTTTTTTTTKRVKKKKKKKKKEDILSKQTKNFGNGKVENGLL
jgi:hypothetical protein